MVRILRWTAGAAIVVASATLAALAQPPNQPGQNPNQPGQQPNQPRQNPNQPGQRPNDPRVDRSTQQLQGRIIRTAADQIVIETADKKEVTVFTRPDTRFLSRDQSIRLADLQVGSMITAGYVMDGARYMANSVSLTAAQQPILEANTQPITQGLQEIEGRIVRTAPDQIIIETSDRRQITVHTRSHTQFLATNTIRFNDLQPGSKVYIISETLGELLTAKKLLTLPAAAGAAAPVSTSPPAVAAPSSSSEKLLDVGTTVDGVVVRVNAPDQIVVQTIDGSEVTVYTNAATAYRISGKAGRFTDLQASDAVSIQYDVSGSRNIARKVIGILAVEGQVIRTVGQNEVILRGADGREMTVFVVPETRYMLTPAGGVFTDLRPGASVAVYYDQLDRRNQARHIVLPQKRPVKR